MYVCVCEVEIAPSERFAVAFFFFLFVGGAWPSRDEEVEFRKVASARCG